MTATDRPLVRTRDLRVTAGEDRVLLVYDVRSDTGHVLNPTVAAVFQLADGTRTVPEIAARLPRLAQLPADTELVDLALHELAAADLLEPGLGPTSALAAPEISRRSLLRRLAVTAGAAAALLPALDSIGGLSQVAASTGRMGKSDSPHATKEERLAWAYPDYPQPSAAAPVPLGSDPLGGSGGAAPAGADPLGALQVDLSDVAGRAIGEVLDLVFGWRR